MKKRLPELKTDKDAEAFVAEAGLTRYDLSGMKSVSFEFQPKGKRITMRRCLTRSRKKPNARGVPYQRFIRQAIENALRSTEKMPF